MAALRDGITTVLIPKDNLRDLEEIDQTVRAALRFIPVETVDEVFAAALCPDQGTVREDSSGHMPSVFQSREPAQETVLRQ